MSWISNSNYKPHPQTLRSGRCGSYGLNQSRDGLCSASLRTESCAGGAHEDDRWGGRLGRASGGRPCHVVGRLVGAGLVK